MRTRTRALKIAKNPQTHCAAGRFLAWSCVALGMVSLGGAGLSGQQPTIAVNVKVVNVLATVRDKHGQIVNNLNKDDFFLQEDGKPQSIGYFSRESNLPLTLGLLVDTSLSQRRVLEQERSASYSFLDKMLQAKDTAFVIHFDREAELLQDLTSSREKLQAALDKLKLPEEPELARGGGQGGGSGGGWPGPGGGGHRAGHGGRDHGGGTVLYDSIYLASDELMKPQQGRKALIVLSDGVDRGSKETLEAALEAAQRADTVVYSILFKDDEAYSHWGGGFGGPGGMGGHGGGHRYPPESRPDGKKVLERISKETGGRLFEVSKKQPIDKIYSELQEELRNQYSIGYTPDKSNEGTGFRKITLTTKEKDLVVQARDGYYAER
ncbi:MAG TPA: VWA domain-containing protein [Terriglobales bacterium]|nr:VWA domain-containing protein [Terriglobales bacterium]